ncbi:tetratricopeptide repeat protein [Pseudomonas tohonis]|uniref:tetratricopeptide repeat protein n=1 Tax=Pseudomonas tohonis TaxID=2725477 RepID=UPI001F39274E|nr:tetratricopeptide repeat protein [Pseudomonas tohonis]
MEYWKRTIEAGNHCFRAGDWIEARERYLQALAQAQMLLERWSDPDQAVAAFVVSHHNLADLHLMLGQPEETAENLCACHERLLQVLRDPGLPETLRDVALRHSRCTYSSLLQFIQEHGAYPRTDRLLGIAPGHSSQATPHLARSRYYH